MKGMVRALALVALAAHTAAAQTADRPAPKRAGADPKATPACGSKGELDSVPEALLGRELKGLDSEPFRLSDFKGRVVVLNFWATWCPPCRSEVYELNMLHTDFAGRGVEIVGLTVEDPQKDSGKVHAFAQQFAQNYRVGWSDRELFCALSQCDTCIPQTFVISGDGRIVKRLRGFYPSVSPWTLREAVEQALSGDAKVGQ